jgi:hypothetical protein
MSSSRCPRTQQLKEASVKSATKQMTMEGAPTGGELRANRTQGHMWLAIAALLTILWRPELHAQSSLEFSLRR